MDRYQQAPLGQEYEYGTEFLNLWKNSAFDPEFMKKMVVFIGELQWLNFPSPIFDWSDDHMQTFNDHLGHFLDLLPELSEFGKSYVAPMARGISQENRQKLADLLSSPIANKFPQFFPKSLATGITNKLLQRGLGI